MTFHHHKHLRAHLDAGGALSGKYLGDEPPKGARFTLFPG